MFDKKICVLCESRFNILDTPYQILIHMATCKLKMIKRRGKCSYPVQDSAKYRSEKYIALGCADEMQHQDFYAYL